jgi:hypothetical protein
VERIGVERRDPAGSDAAPPLLWELALFGRGCGGVMPFVVAGAPYVLAGPMPVAPGVTARL